MTEIDNLRSENTRLRQAIHEIDLTLRIPAAEYVPAIGDVFTIIDQLKLSKRQIHNINVTDLSTKDAITLINDAQNAFKTPRNSH